VSKRGKGATHPIGDEVLLAFAAGDAGSLGQAAAAVAAHVAVCPNCAATVRRYRLAEATVRADARCGPSPAALARAKAAFAPAPPAPVAAPVGALRRIVARLTFDGRADGFGMAGVRGGHELGRDSFQVAYESEVGEVDLQVEPEDEAVGTWRLLGQLSTEEERRARVALAPAGGEAAVAETEADPDGMFDLVAASGRYDLLVRLPETELVLPDLNLG
jgi:hypothetical protein